ncbi:helix-turn-helix domain-containing protein [Nitrospirillum pindoramense]|uniref:helix-turn-helix domain-containing protein n=1 Tax=Nitrospirillum amazonense TaxID=28077 RepID=UPI001645F06E|nr:helix-turn-helix transcriptional regulator [Nitrospirillum amazonense]
MAHRDKFDPTYTAIIAALVTERKRRGVTQALLADRMGTTQSIVSKYERRELLLDLLDYVRYCAAMGVDAGDFLKGFTGVTIQS